MDSTRTEQVAAEWLAKRDGESWTAADEATFDAWQRESALHRVAVIRLRKIWGEADRLRALGAGIPPGTIPAPGQWRLSGFAYPSARGSMQSEDATELLRDRSAYEQGTLRRRMLHGLAAGVILAVTTASAAYWWNDKSLYATEVGQLETVPMSDGSQVVLNTDSSIRVALTDQERLVELRQGEAFFEVAKDVKRPFIVQAGDQRVIAIGTAFSVKRNAREVKVVVTEGAVRIEKGGSASGPATELRAGNIAQAGEAGVLLRESSLVEAEKTLSWRYGYLAFQETSLEQAVEEFNRYNEKKLRIADQELAALRIGGNLRATNVDAFVRVLEKGFPVQARDDGEEIVLSSR